MDKSLVERLLDAERQAARMVEEEHGRLEQVMAGFEQEKHRMREEGIRAAERRIEELRARQQEHVEQQARAAHRRYAQLQDGLRQKYEHNHKQWEEELYARCISRAWELDAGGGAAVALEGNRRAGGE